LYAVSSTDTVIRTSRIGGLHIYGEFTLAAKLDSHDEAVYECPANVRDEATLVAKRHMSVRVSHAVKLHSNESSFKGQSAKLASRWSYMKFRG